MVIEMPSSPQPNAAEQLRWDMEVAASPPPEPVPPPVPAEAVDPSPRIIEMPEPRQQPTAAELLRQEMAAATPPPAAATTPERSGWVGGRASGGISKVSHPVT